MARVLGAARESGRGEESVSIENQEKRIREWAADHGHTVVAVTVDKATSGGTAARERPELGPWLNDPAKIAQWDILAGAKLDRMSRSVLDFSQTQEWASGQGKSLVSVAEGYDFSTAEGELMAYQLVAFAQFERKRASQRRAEAAQLILDIGRWNGGRFPYGYAPSGHDGNWRLVQDDVTSKVALRMINEALAGKSLNAIAAGLNDDGIPSPLGRKWRDTAVRRILTSPALTGQTVKMKGSVLTVRRDRDGQPVTFTDEPLITSEKQDELKRVMATRARSRGAPQARHLLWDVAFCPVCKGKLYGHRHLSNAKQNYYQCRNCLGVNARLEKLDAAVESFLLSQWGDRVLETLKVVKGDDHSAEIARLEAKAERWREDLAEEHTEGLASDLEALEGRIDALRRKREPDRAEWVPVATGETVAAYWARSDSTARNALLRLSGYRAIASKDGSVIIQRGHPGQITDGLVIPHDTGDSEDVYQIAEVNFIRDEDGTLRVS